MVPTYACALLVCVYVHACVSHDGIPWYTMGGRGITGTVLPPVPYRKNPVVRKSTNDSMAQQRMRQLLVEHMKAMGFVVGNDDAGLTETFKVLEENIFFVWGSRVSKRA